MLLMLFAILISMSAPVLGQARITPGQPVKGDIVGAEDTWLLTAESGQIFSIRLDSDDFDPYLEIEDSSGEVIAYDDDGGISLNSALVFVSPLSQTYTVRVSPYEESDGGAYTLTVDTLTAQPVVIDGDQVEFSLGGPDAEMMAVYTFKIDEPVSLTTSANSAEYAYVVLTLMRVSGEIIASEEAINPGIRRTMLDEIGRYYVVVELSDVEVTPLDMMLSIVVEEPIRLYDEPVTLTISNFTEVFTVDMVRGATYEIALYPRYAASGSLTIDPETGYGYFSFGQSMGLTTLYVARTTGLIRIEVTDYSYSDEEQTYEISVKFICLCEPRSDDDEL
jgi:hypothetical protein